MRGQMTLEEVLVMVGMAEENRMARISVEFADRNRLLPAVQRQNLRKDRTE